MRADEPPRTEPPSRPRVVLLDDDPAFVNVARDMLETEGGCDVDVHERWEDAVAFVKAHRPDLVILDVLFGGEQQGLSILLQLKEDPATRQIPLIVCSADRISLQSYQVLFADYDVLAVEKPFNVDDFLRAIDERLRNQPRRA